MSTILVQAMGWALLHLLWQALLVAGALAVALRLVGARAANTRYALACGALLLVAALPVATGVRAYARAAEARQAATVAPMPAALTAPAVQLAPLPPRAAADAQEAAPAPRGPEDWAGPALLRALVALESNVHLLVLAWAMGVSAASLRVLLAWRRLRALTRAARPAPLPWQHTLALLSTRLRVWRPVRLLASAEIDVPAAAGWLRPVVLVPVSALTGLPTRQLELILAHELAHIRRHDFTVNLLQTAVETLLFYHPAVWWISRVIRVEREHCCDDVAADTAGSALSYARALTALEALRGAPEPALSALGGSLPDRVRRLVVPGGRCATRWSAGASALTLAAGLALCVPLLLSIAPGEAVARTQAAQQATVADVEAQDAAAGVMPTPPLPVVTPAAPAAPLPAPAAALRKRPSASVPAPPAPPAAPAPAAAPHPLAAPAPVPAPDPGPRLLSGPTHVVLAQAPAPEDGARKGKDTKAKGEKAKGEKAEDRPANRITVAADGTVNIERLETDDLVALRTAGLTPERIRELAALGLGTDVDTLVAMGHAGVTTEYARAMSAKLGKSLTADDLVGMRHQGVTPEFVSELEAQGVKVAADDLTGAAAVGVNAVYVREMGDAGFKGLSLDALTDLRAVGVTSAYVKELKRLGFDKLDADTVQGLRAVGVTPVYVKELRDVGFKGLDADTVQGLRAVGVTPDYVRELQSLGFKELDADAVQGLRALGVSAEYARGLKAEGVQPLGLEELRDLRAMGVTPEFVREMRAAGIGPLDAETLTRLRASGVDAEFVRRMKGGAR